MADEDEEFDEEGVVVGQLPVVSVPRHIKKRALKNKALTVGFNDKELRDFVTGFHKRKKKRRKEAQRQLQEKERLQRIEARKKRKQDREIALYGRILSSENPPEAASELNDAGDYEQEENEDITASVSETKMYEDANATITVTTSAISHEDDDDDDLKQTNAASMVSSRNEKPEKPRGLALKKKPLKKVAKHRSNKGGKKRALGKKTKKNSRSKRG